MSKDEKIIKIFLISGTLVALTGTEEFVAEVAQSIIDMRVKYLEVYHGGRKYFIRLKDVTNMVIFDND